MQNFAKSVQLKLKTTLPPSKEKSNAAFYNSFRTTERQSAGRVIIQDNLTLRMSKTQNVRLIPKTHKKDSQKTFCPILSMIGSAQYEIQR